MLTFKQFVQESVKVKKGEGNWHEVYHDDMHIGTISSFAGVSTSKGNRHRKGVSDHKKTTKWVSQPPGSDSRMQYHDSKQAAIDSLVSSKGISEGIFDFIKKKLPPKNRKVFHGSKNKHKELKLPEKNNPKNADGHAIYVTTHKPEAISYGKHLHHVDFHAHDHELINLDRHTHNQHPEVKEKIKKVAAKHGVSIHGKGEYSMARDAEAVDVVHRLGKKIGYEKTTEEFKKHGIVGGYGESFSGGKKGKPMVSSRVYSVYDHSRLKVKKIVSSK